MSLSYLEVEGTLRGMGFPLWKIESLVRSGLTEKVRDRDHLIEGARALLAAHQKWEETL